MGRNIYKCAYPKCKYGGEVNKNEAVKVSNRYYHKECLAEKNAKLEIIDVWVAKVDPHPIFNLLRKTIDNLVDKEGNDAEYLLFALRYSIDHGWKISHPAGLRYVAKNKDAENEWNKRKEYEITRDIKENLRNISDLDSNESWSLPELSETIKTNKKNVSKILGV